MFEILIVLAVLLAAIVLFVTDKLRVDLVALLVMAALLTTGVISPTQGIAGFSNTATVTVAAMFILSAGLFRTGAVNFLGTFVNQLFAKGFWVGIFAVMVIVGVMSAFINNTPVIAIFLPILVGVARETGISPSKILMPVSFASMFGGVCTLIGTSTNILVDAIAQDSGLPGFSMFEFAPLGIIMFAIGVGYLMLVGIRLIPDRRGGTDLADDFSLSDYITEIILLPDSISAGKRIIDSPLVKDLDISILAIRRGEERIQQPRPETVLLPDDVLLVRCNLESIRAMQEKEGLKLTPQAKWGEEGITSEDYRLLEVVIDPNSGLEGTTLKTANFRGQYGATVLAIRHKGRLLRERLAETVLSAGDLLLIEVHSDRLSALRQSGDFIVVSETNTVEFRRGKVFIAVTIVAGVIIAASVNLAPIVVTSVVGAILLVLLRCITLDEAYEAIEWKIIFLLAGVLSLGVALETTGAANLIASNVVGAIGQYGNIALVSAFYLLTVLLTSAMSNNATGALLAPIGIATAASLGVDPKPFLIAIMFAASSSFLTPIGYQTNTMIYGPGQYKFFDFVKVGTPLNIILWIAATILIPMFWSF